MTHTAGDPIATTPLRLAQQALEAFRAHYEPQCADYPRSEWRQEVANEGTGADYWQWAFDSAASDSRLEQLMPSSYALPTSQLPGEAAQSEFEKDVAIFKDHHGNECATYPREDWLYEVENGDTLSGYWNWAYCAAERDEQLQALMPGGVGVPNEDDASAAPAA